MCCKVGNFNMEVIRNLLCFVVSTEKSVEELQQNLLPGKLQPESGNVGG